MNEFIKILNLIKADFYEWAEWLKVLKNFNGMIKLILHYSEYRCLVCYRFEYRKSLLTKIAKRIISIMKPTSHNQYFCNENIGAGLRIIHGFSTIINAKSIGKHCIISQQVMIGRPQSGLPTIGGYCKVYAGAKLLGAGKNWR